MLDFIVATIIATAEAGFAPPATAVPATPSPVQSCRGAIGGGGSARLDAHPGLVEGAALRGGKALVALRRSRGNRLIVVRGGDFSGADLRGARLDNICFYMTDLSGSDWRGVRARGIGFIDARLAGADLRGARMPGVSFEQPDLDGADASGADFSGGSLSGNAFTSLEDVRLDRADLSRFEIHCGITEEDSCGNNKRISFRHANLSRAVLHSYRGRADWTGARLDRTEVSLRHLENLGGARIAGTLIVRGGEASVRVSPAEYRALVPHLVSAEQPAAPSFDCRRARSRVEREICAPDATMLRRLDLDMAEAYAEARAVDPRVRAGQRAWLRARDRCHLDCVFDLYRSRIDALIVRIGRPGWARPGRRALFVAPTVEFDAPFRAGPLYRRLLPVIVGSASTRLIVRVNADGTAAAAGTAIGSNAHQCSLGGGRLRFDAATGWLSGAPVARPGDPPAWRTLPVPLLRFRGDRAEVYDNGHPRLEEDLRFLEYMACGARAGFAEMVRVPATRALLAQVGRELYGYAADGDPILAMAN